MHRHRRTLHRRATIIAAATGILLDLVGLMSGATRNLAIFATWALLCVVVGFIAYLLAYGPGRPGAVERDRRAHDWARAATRWQEYANEMNTALRTMPHELVGYCAGREAAGTDDTRPMRRAYRAAARAAVEKHRLMPGNPLWLALDDLDRDGMGFAKRPLLAAATRDIVKVDTYRTLAGPFIQATGLPMPGGAVFYDAAITVSNLGIDGEWNEIASQHMKTDGTAVSADQWAEEIARRFTFHDPAALVARVTVNAHDGDTYANGEYRITLPRTTAPAAAPVARRELTAA